MSDHDHDCGEVLEQLYVFIDGELTIERRVVIQRHLEHCHDCLEAFDFEAELKLMVSQKCRETLPDALRRKVADAIAQFGDDPGSELA